MKRFQLLSVLKLAAICILILVVPYPATNAAVQHGFRIKEYELFHDVLEPLQHEAFPKADFQRIRLMATELVTRGKAIVKLGLPEAPKASRREFVKARRKFDMALTRFRTYARSGNNTRVKDSFTAVHDSFEELADLVPTVYPGGMPTIVSLNCPSSQSEAGSKITLTASTTLPEKQSFLWTVDKGKILSGQGTPTITIDTIGLAGQTISIRVEVTDDLGHVTIANCVVQISAGN